MVPTEEREWVHGRDQGTLMVALSPSTLDRDIDGKDRSKHRKQWLIEKTLHLNDDTDQPHV